MSRLASKREVIRHYAARRRHTACRVREREPRRLGTEEELVWSREIVGKGRMKSSVLRFATVLAGHTIG